MCNYERVWRLTTNFTIYVSFILAKAIKVILFRHLENDEEKNITEY